MSVCLSIYLSYLVTFFGTGFLYVAYVELDFVILLPQSPGITSVCHHAWLLYLLSYSMKNGSDTKLRAVSGWSPCPCSSKSLLYAHQAGALPEALIAHPGVPPNFHKNSQEVRREI
jgi:hypothetical protein